MRSNRWLVLGFTVTLLWTAGAAEASLAPFQVISGEVAVSSDALGTTSGTGTLTATVPVGSTVVGAYLYAATFFNNAVTPTAVTLNGNATTMVQRGGGISFLNSFRADVTSIVAPVINSGAGGAYNFALSEGANNGLINGTALVVIYQKTGLPIGTVAVLDGFSAQGGDSHKVIFSEALNTGAPGFFAEMRIASSHSCCGQTSNVTVNGTLITQNAGNADDGTASNGALITMGGDDDPFSALLPSYADDHERYNLVPFITNGDTEIDINTNNPTFDDDIFLNVFYVFGRAGIDEPPPPDCGPNDPNCPPPTPAPAPASLALLGLGLAGAAAWRRWMSR